MKTKDIEVGKVYLVNRYGSSYYYKVFSKDKSGIIAAITWHDNTGKITNLMSLEILAPRSFVHEIDIFAEAKAAKDRSDTWIAESNGRRAAAKERDSEISAMLFKHGLKYFDSHTEEKRESSNANSQYVYTTYYKFREDEVLSIIERLNTITEAYNQGWDDGWSDSTKGI